ncbi:16S rRNA (cytidine1402-2'-O)-methyltransferase [Chitinophaga ginsengisegetis]|jgi:16S rRNA (cytidine1402-2'-O)-methyltransferase|uniref:16S rRNA (Cytidine1402-2'-O)-methyltransferase n=1 Tax=Chitinophaga ginsengisegetis TaxID=393003 RepID=A0A1T5P4R3_9BACT|nr:SAM-dependent methyltransferase [Chitinophaga ginsengisegetis]MDR6570310.1 16S rRNA (cytidine1402-2'-O)-methyltransferase [Chitinophaga ginsengisegetis]MDR6650044.1 16S rRNA (cytidine1402-2'-O)-methyltransferase [Chitinophaga ginsengisegetis]MDR6656315.1 16S rRNA (cytidine1402-2'-O)-methyltransferase [Chitinophaga ginsengisegetis]SKD07682.1 16S rRNA (cytidine1402-2'-O)-methyltransferase [Chitinophaga ginsengisegetis]
MNTTGKVYLVPTVLSADALFSIPAYVTAIVQQLSVFYVENERTARRYLKSLDRNIVIDNLQLLLMNENQAPDLVLAKKLLLEGKDIGILSEAGCPAIADPGHLIVKLAQSIDARVIPMIGPNSMLLALMASGMNGQNFQFVGYLPIKPPERTKMIRELEQESEKKKQTQLFIETPYRNNQLLKDILDNCKDYTQICIAADITAPTEYIKTKTVKEWKKQLPDLHKRPAIFLLYAGNE